MTLSMVRAAAVLMLVIAATACGPIPCPGGGDWCEQPPCRPGVTMACRLSPGNMGGGN